MGPPQLLRNVSELHFYPRTPSPWARNLLLLNSIHLKPQLLAHGDRHHPQEPTFEILLVHELPRDHPHFIEMGRPKLFFLGRHQSNLAPIRVGCRQHPSNDGHLRTSHQSGLSRRKRELCSNFQLCGLCLIHQCGCCGSQRRTVGHSTNTNFSNHMKPSRNEHGSMHLKT